MIIYKLEDNGQATNLQFSKTEKEGYTSIEGDRLPDIETLHSQEYKEFVNQQGINSAALRWLRDNDWKVNQYLRRVKRKTITPEQEVEYLVYLDDTHAKAQEIVISVT